MILRSSSVMRLQVHSLAYRLLNKSVLMVSDFDTQAVLVNHLVQLRKLRLFVVAALHQLTAEGILYLRLVLVLSIKLTRISLSHFHTFLCFCRCYILAGVFMRDTGMNRFVLTSFNDLLSMFLTFFAIRF